MRFLSVPNYTFEDKNSGEVQTVTLTLAEHEEFVKANPHLEQIIAVPGFTTRLAMGSRLKPSESFRERLRDIKKKHPNSKIDTF